MRSKTEEPTTNSRVGIIVAFVGVLVMVMLIIIGMATTSSPASSGTDTTDTSTKTASAPAPKPEAKFSWQSNLVGPINPATEQVAVSTANISDVTGTPQCYIQVEDASGVYHGSGFFADPNPLAPGQTWSFRGDVIVTNEGAAYVTKGGVSCLEK